MKVLLINPKNTHVIKSNFPAEIDKETGPFAPLGLLYIAAFLKKSSRHAVDVLDMEMEDIDFFHLENIIKEDKPDIVGIYTTTFTLIDVYLTAQIIKEADNTIHITLGGPHINIYPDESISNKNIDSIILGEGEVAFSRLVDALEKKIGLGHINGLVYKDKRGVIKTSAPRPIYDLDALPYPDRTMISYESYGNILSHDLPSATMISGRGCPHSCIFCYHSSLGKDVRLRSVDNIISEIENCLNLGIKDIFFYDDTFVLNKQRTIDICNAIIDRGFKMPWGIRTRIDSVNKDILTKLKQAGCQRIHFGVEAGTSKILSVLNRRMSIAQIKEGFRLTRETGIKTLAYFMIGSPTEQLEDIQETIDFAIMLKPDYAHFSITMPLPGTDLYKMGLETRLFKNDFWKEFAISPSNIFSPQFWDKELSQEKMNQLLKYANRRFYFRPYYIFKTLLRTTSLRDLRKKMKMGLGLIKFISNC